MPQPIERGLSVSARYRDVRGEYALVITTQPGPCGACRKNTSCFVDRAGRTVCTDCDTKEEMQWRAGQRLRKL